MINFWLRCQFVPRHSYKPAGLCHDSKNRAMLRSFRLVPGLYPDDIFCSSLHSLSNTNALYCRAV
ncbi:MAG: hypothetical protein MUO72_01745, partial [Bacteroidales bacterium]|nr:hypothetical protein [Bacteroidales bacterium]